jgi:transcription elongation factor Elf1
MVKAQTPVNEGCPFCGKKAIAEDTLNHASGKPAHFRVKCRVCGGSTGWYKTAEEGWDAWNTRARVKPEKKAKQ